MSFKTPENPPQFKLNQTNTLLKVVTDFRYLGHNCSSKDKSYFLDAQVQAAHTAFNRHKITLTNKHTSIKNRITLYESLVRSVMLYSVQAWDLTKAQKYRLEVTDKSFLRKIIGKGWKDRQIFSKDENGETKIEFEPLISDKRLYEITHTVPIQDFITKQFLKFTAHVSRMPNSNVQKRLQFIVAKNQGQENIWSRCGKYLGGIDEIQVRKLMQDRGKFRREIEARFGTRRSTQSKKTKVSG